MKCYRCQTVLAKEEYCPTCQADVHVYKRIIYLSNMYYNEGLEKAHVRDLSGAAVALRKSLKYDKMNILARNLLGLIYFEMGETVSALSEWVISRNLKPESNSAEQYLSIVQSGQSKLDVINQTIRKYNQALAYCKQDSKDLAALQLKKVLSLNPNLIKGHQLLALLYMEEGKGDLAKKSLMNAMKIDRNNTTTLRYLQVLDEDFVNGAPPRKGTRKGKEAPVSYRSGNDTIIRPTNFKDYSAVTTILNIAIGAVLGILITWFLIVPNVKQKAKSEANKAILEASDAIATKNQSMKTLEDEITALQNQIAELETNLSTSERIIDTYEKLLIACDALARGDVQGAGDGLELVTPDDLREPARAIYDSINTQASAQYMETVYAEGNDAYRRQDFPVAVEKLARVVEIDEGYHNGDAIYYLGQSYRKLEDYENARLCYEKVAALFPGTEKARNSGNYLESMQ
ncbi:tetratricopeptide repeat protein [Lachnospiraceae bacterium ZAX-1]